MEPDSIFGKHKLSTGEQFSFSTDFFSLRVKRKKEGWVIQEGENKQRHAHSPAISAGEYFHTGKSGSLLILPSLPSKPIVFKGNVLHVSPGQKMVFYLKIPLSVQLYYSKAQPVNLLKEIIIKRLSDTWFGDSFNGEPAFSLGNEFYFSTNDINPSAFDALCPVTIYNNSPGVLKIERLIIRVENMTLYKNDGRIITSLLAIEYKGKETISSASYHFSKSFHGEKEDVIAKPASWGSRNILKINFHFIKNILQN